MKTVRILFFLFLFYFLVPFDLYNTTHYRVYYFGTDLYKERVSFSSNTATFKANYTFNLVNCKTYLYHDSAQDSRSFFIEFGFPYGTPHTFNQSVLNISAPPTQTCIVNLFLPMNTSLPAMIFNVNGTQDNIMFDDSQYDGSLPLNFTNGLTIYGDSAFINLQNHFISTFYVNLQFSIVNINSIFSPNKTIIV